jgi:hypothetical protein
MTKMEAISFNIALLILACWGAEKLHEPMKSTCQSAIGFIVVMVTRATSESNPDGTSAKLPWKTPED